MTKRCTIFDELDPFDSLDEVDGFEGFSVDNEEPAWYNGIEDSTFCDFGVGDVDGLCIKGIYGCNIEGCETATQNN